MSDWKHHLLENNPFPAILGQKETKDQVRSALLARRHMLIVGPPGIGKTTLAKSVAALLPSSVVNDCGFHCDPKHPRCPTCLTTEQKTVTISGEDKFVRVQGSPDLTVEDLFGDIDPVKALQFGAHSAQAFTPGKIFRAHDGILFFDELNRAPEKTQNALLQVLEEGTVTIGSYTIDIPSNFIFIGTMNPEDSAATEKLSSVLMDRFDVIRMTYPDSVDIESEIITSRAQELRVPFPEPLLMTVLQFIHTLRANKNLVRKPSVRASLGLYERAQANALLAKHKEVTFDDIMHALISVLAHRIELKPSLKFVQSPEQFIASEFKAFSQENPDVASTGGGDL